MYSIKTGLILGFHGTDLSVRDSIVSHAALMKKSDNEYDWLGTGFYFWENDFHRAMEFAEEVKARPHNHTQSIENPAVLGAVIDLGFCLNLLDNDNMKYVTFAYNELAKVSGALPQNDHPDESGMPMRRRLDRAVFEYLHELREDETPFDSVRSAFIEGERAFPNAGFHKKTHIQICIRNPNCIKGFFIPREDDQDWEFV
jgi:hypothetical protein